MGWLRGAILEKVISSSIGSEKLPWWFFMLILSIDIFDAIGKVGGKYANLNNMGFQELNSIKTPKNER